MGSRTDCQLLPSPQTTEGGPWKSLATLTPILSLMEISAASSGSQVGVSSSLFLVAILGFMRKLGMAV